LSCKINPNGSEPANNPRVDRDAIHSTKLIGVMTIADEIDSQLSQAMASYIEESVSDHCLLERSCMPTEVSFADSESVKWLI
jgi:hypothetical protein